MDVLGRGRGSELNRPALGLVVGLWLLLELGVIFGGLTPPAFGASVSSTSFTGGAGTVTVGGTLYAKQGGALTLNVVTDDDTKCVEITGAHTAAQTSSTAKTNWVFSLTAGAGSGIQTVTATAYRNFNRGGNCTANGGEHLGTHSASYRLDNTGPVVTGSLNPRPNAAGWNRDNVTIDWFALDADSGVPSSSATASETINAETAGATRSHTVADLLGNSGTGQVTVRLDKTAPNINASKSPAPNAAGWNNTDVTISFTCSDALSGIKSCTGGGSTTLSTEGENQSVPGTAVDNADNINSAGVSGINIDKTAPTLSGSPTTAANAEGWYRADVTIDWTASDALSGVASAPAESTITGEGTGLFATRSVSDRAGNATQADSAKVNIDRTPPTTSATAPTGWSNTAQTITLDATDGLSGVKTTHYVLDGGAEQTGNTVEVSGDGVHTLEYWSVDKAGNAETAKTVNVKVDGTSPRISFTQSPLANTAGWNRTNVEVTFQCEDDTSGIASCTPKQVVSTEGASQAVKGTATDNAGNSVDATARVSIDKTAPRISAAADRDANRHGWYAADVTVSFDCSDALSGIAGCPDAKTLGEGAGQSASGSATDAAGNEASAQVTGINVDKTAPSLSGAPTTDANDNGWYRGDVVIAWSCSDALSGVDGDCPASRTLDGEGDDLTASASVSDKAGNVENATSPSVKIDRTPPSTTASVPDALESGWHTAAVEVTLSGSDALSKVDRTYYTVDTGEPQLYTGPFAHSLGGEHTIRFWSVDRAGNLEDATQAANTIKIKIDNVKPTITGTRTTANSFGWNNSDVVVSFACDDAESGIAGCTPATTLINEGAGQEVEGIATDNAGNSATKKIGPINIDKTAPTLTGEAASQPNAAGWHRGDVTVRWEASDGLSGIDPDTVPADSVVTGEGTALATGEVSVSDKAGNVTKATKGGFDIDRTPPTIEGAPTTRPNGAGWYTGDVIVAFSCKDNLSGVASCPSDKVVSGNAAGQAVTSDPAVDNAGNTADGKTVGGINIDGLAPQTTADNQCTKTNGWCTGSTANVVLSASDQPGLSGVKEIRYSINGGGEQIASGASKTVSVPLDGDGEAKIAFYAVDNAGNAESLNGVALQYDNIAPTVTHTVSPKPNADQWNNSDVTVRFEAKDNDKGSGVDASRTTSDVEVTEETAERVVEGEAYDLAGNRGTDKVTVRLDKTAPGVEGAIIEGTKGQNGWYVGPVTVHFTCSDGLSGIAVCPDDVTLVGNGADQSVSGKAIDKAGNSRTATVSGINIDQAKPTISVADVKALYPLGAEPSLSCTAKDDHAGVESCEVRVTGGNANGVGEFTWTATATDRAGNQETQSGTYRVIYKWGGFRQPITDTAHQTGASASMFKAGSTVPVKFQLTKADGTVVAAASAPAWPAPIRGGMTSEPVNQDDATLGGDTGLAYRWDADGRQYIYNWATPKAGAGYYHRIGVTLDDGQSYSVNVGLR